MFEACHEFVNQFGNIKYFCDTNYKVYNSFLACYKNCGVEIAGHQIHNVSSNFVNVVGAELGILIGFLFVLSLVMALK